jgi:hypothetical protein
MKNFFSMGEVARTTGIPCFRISYAINRGFIPEASCRLAGKRVFSDDDVTRIYKHFGVHAPEGATHINGKKRATPRKGNRA